MLYKTCHAFAGDEWVLTLHSVRLMRAVTPHGPFRETGEEQYAHTPFSEIYLAKQMGAMYNMM